MSIEIKSSELAEELGHYLLKREVWGMEGNPDTPIEAAYNKAGAYVGNWREARFLQDRGISAEKRTPDSNVTSIGFCEREQKWYGWSHRAIFGYGVGDVVRDGDLDMPAGFKVTTVADAKRCAKLFAESVS